jgi:hypothetical protein
VGLLSSRSNGASGTFFSFEARVIMVISPFICWILAFLQHNYHFIRGYCGE